jgi:general secretion pathway protein F
MAPLQRTAAGSGLAATPRAAARGRFPLRLFSQELAVLLRAGVPLLEALRSLREQETSFYVTGVLDDILDPLSTGQSLSASLRRRPDAFDALFVAVVAASEQTGQTESGLVQHASYLLWVERLRDKLVAASIYPATLLVAGSAVLLFLVLFVVPRFAGILETGGRDLPAASRALLVVGRFGDAHPWLSIGIAAVLLATPLLAWREPAVRAAAVARLWQMPVLGSRLRLLALARFYRTASMLIGAGVPAVAALLRSRDVIAAPLRPQLDDAIDAVKRGERFSLALDRAGLTTPVSLRMVRVGEQSGELGRMLGEAAAFHDEELTRLTEIVTRIVNPAIMLVMGGVIGAVVVLMYLPIFQLAEQVQ